MDLFKELSQGVVRGVHRLSKYNHQLSSNQFSILTLVFNLLYRRIVTKFIYTNFENQLFFPIKLDFSFTFPYVHRNFFKAFAFV